jgi:DMSO/TMAO reductase YedYZ molybdopterin-dependent catalytic subunit
MLAEGNREAKQNRRRPQSAIQEIPMSNAARTTPTMGLSLLLVALLVLASNAIAAPQSATLAAAASSSASAPALVIKGAVKKEVSMTLAELKAATRVKLSARGHDGAMHEYEGVALQTLLAKAGVAAAADLRGKNMTLFVLAEAGDGYRAVFSLAELDADFAAEAVLVADTADGKKLGPDQGPLRLVVPGDKRQGRWVRILTSITVAAAP